jgi:hypothetical protein
VTTAIMTPSERELDRRNEVLISLQRDHDALERLARDLLSVVAGGDWLAIGSAFDVAERRIFVHLEIEEAELLPGYAVVAPNDAAIVRNDHARIRDALAEIGLEVDLHGVRLDMVQRLVDRVREHTERENAGLYRWAAARDGR